MWWRWKIHFTDDGEWTPVQQEPIVRCWIRVHTQSTNCAINNSHKLTSIKLNSSR